MIWKSVTFSSYFLPYFPNFYSSSSRSPTTPKWLVFRSRSNIYFETTWKMSRPSPFGVSPEPNNVRVAFSKSIYCLIMGTKKWQMSILGESEHLKQLKHFLRVCSETSERSTLIFSKLLMFIYTFIIKLKCQPRR